MGSPCSQHFFHIENLPKHLLVSAPQFCHQTPLILLKCWSNQTPYLLKFGYIYIPLIAIITYWVEKVHKYDREQSINFSKYLIHMDWNISLTLSPSFCLANRFPEIAGIALLVAELPQWNHI